MAADVISFDIHKANAYSEKPKFDLEPVRSQSSPVNSQVDIEVTEDIKFNPEIDLKKSPPKQWELDVRGLISTWKWLKVYGLKRNRLAMSQLLPQMGFKHSDDFDKAMKKPICSRYGSNLFVKHFRQDGNSFNVACTKDKLRQLEARLSQAMCLYKRRLEWLTTESRRIFGVIEENSICIVLDHRNMTPQQFDQYRSALERVLREQIAQLAKFNLIRASEDLKAFSAECVPVTADSIDDAIRWLWDLERQPPLSSTSTCEAVMKALADKKVEACYLFTEGTSCDGTREILKEKLTGARIPVHVVSYNCTNAGTISFLKDLTRITGGRFHAYAVIMEMDSYEAAALQTESAQANIILKKKTYGGVPPGAGMREDVILLFEELEEARSNLAQIQGLIQEYPNQAANSTDGAPDADKPSDKSETYMSSREWIGRHGLKAKKLGFYDILAGVAFKHQDGVVDLMHAPCEEYQTDAVMSKRLVNARYCDKFPHVRWKDGQVVHVQVTPEIHRNYEQRMRLTIEAIQQRIDWLQQGSRELFGTVIEDQIYILVDTSASMAPHIQFVKDKLFVLMQEQLRHKQRFNIIAFDSKSSSWKDRLVDVNEKNLHTSWQWIKSLVCRGSTNTLSALRHALSDPQTQAVYLITDGRPDQPPKSILAQVQLHPSVPVHTISFNCADKQANEFLCQLAKDTGGRFHYYSENGIDPEGPEPWESEDIRLLKLELELGYRNLEKIAMLRDECASLAWRKEDGGNKCSREHPLPDKGKESAVPPLDPMALYRSYDSMMERPRSAPGYRYQPSPPSRVPRPSTAHGFRGSSRSKALTVGSRPYASRSTTKAGRQHGQRNGPPKPLTAGHTRTSLLRSLSSSGSYDSPEWLLPETRQLFEKQWNRQQKINEVEEKKKKKRSKKTKKLTDDKNLSSKKWLSVHGLVAKKLTILDALAPTFIPHKPKYISIIDKHVGSKVFDEILPIAHTKSKGRGMKIVNPMGVNLKVYQEKVQIAIEKYNRRLDCLVWDALPEKERAEFPSEDLPPGPVSYLENKLKMMQALDRSGWPCSEKDIILLENEIRQGEMYIQQAKDLQAAAQSRGRELEEDDGGKAYDDAASVASSANGKQYEHLLRENEGINDSGSEGLGQAIETKTVMKEKHSKLSKSRIKKTLDVLRGQKIIGRNEVDGFYYPGFVIKCPDTRHAFVEYDEIGQQTVATRFVIPISGAIARPPIRVGDHVLARVVNQDTGLECFVPGLVTMTPKRMEDQAKFFTIGMYNGQINHFLRTHLVKISKMRHTFLVRYIAEINQKTDNDNRSVSSAESFNNASARHSRSRSRSPSSSCSDSRSKSRSGSRSRSPSSSRTSSRSRCSSGSRSRSRSHSGSPRKSRSRSRSPESSPTQESIEGSSRSDKSVKIQKRRLAKWQRHLEKQQRKQARDQKRIKKQAKKLQKLQKQLGTKRVRTGDSSDTQRLLEIILEELNRNKKGNSSQHVTTTFGNDDNRTQEWVQEQSNGETNLALKLHNDKEGIIVSHGDRGVLISSRPPQATPPFILELRKLLSKLKEGEEILARWADEGWYYRGTIRQEVGDGSYFVEDAVGNLEKIWREDIVADGDDADIAIQAKDPVIAMHPHYMFSYAPGVVLEVDTDLFMQIRFYDGSEVRLPREEVYKTLPQKFELDVSYILRCEEQWVGQAVVARNDDTGSFQLGAVRERIGNGRQYVIEWSDGTLSVQASPLIFGAFTKRHPLAIGDRVLAISEPAELTYLPGWITKTNGNKMVVKFCDGATSHHVNSGQCFWLSQEFYDAAVAFYRNKQEGLGDEEE